MARPLIVLGDKTNHGGTVISGYRMAAQRCCAFGICGCW